MSSPKGYSSQKKDFDSAQFTTVNPVTTELYGLDVNAHLTVQVVGTDAIEANSTTQILNLTAHAIQRGDVIRFTSGALDGKEVVVAAVINANSVRLGETLSSAPAAAVTIDVLRHKKLTLDVDGAVPVSGTLSTTPGPLLFVRDGVEQEVTEDTALESNNRPLPVDLIDVNGQRGTSTNKLHTTDTTSQSKLDTIGTATAATAISVDNVEGLLTLRLPASLGSKTDANSLSVTLASDDALTTAIKNAVETLDNAIAGSEMQVDVITLPALPAGTNNIGDVDVLTLPSIPAGTNNIGDVDVLTLPSIPAGTNNIGDVDVLTLPTAPGRAKVAMLTNNHASVSITTSAYVQLTASTSAEINVLDIFDSSGSMLLLAVGAAAAEVDQIYIFPGGNGKVPLKIPSGSRISVKALDTNTTAGRLLINGLA